MSLEWATSVVEGRRITHWKKLNPVSILEALETPPLRKVGVDPVVRVHKLGQHEIAVRRFVPPTWDGAGQRLFAALRETADRKAAIVEMPVALIEQPTRSIIVTLWKKKTRDLYSFLSDKSVALNLKRKFCLSAMRKMAWLHAIGFAHGHVALNFVADEKGNAHFVDYTRIKPLGQLSQRMEKSFFAALVQIMHHLQTGEESNPGAFLLGRNALPKQARGFYDRLEREYDEWHVTYKKKFEKL